MEYNKIYKCGYLKTAKRKNKTFIPCLYTNDGDFYRVFYYEQDLFDFFVEGYSVVRFERLFGRISAMLNWSLTSSLAKKTSIKPLDFRIIKIKKLDLRSEETSGLMLTIRFDEKGKIILK